MGKGVRTRAAILTAAVETACLGGFRGLNLQPLADRVGMTKSGLYAHFRSKAALQVATLEHAASLFQATVVLPAKLEAAGLPRLAGVFDRWLAWPANAGLPGQCPFFAAGAEFEGGEPAVRERLLRLFADFREVIEQLVASGVRHGHLPADTVPAQFAHELLALRFAQHWSGGFLGDAGAIARTRAAFDRLTGRPAPGQRLPSTA